MKTFVEIDEKIITPKIWLRNEFNKRKIKNPRYSLRAFSKLINLDASSVSQILNGKRLISNHLIQKISSKIDTDKKTYEKLMNYV